MRSVQRIFLIKLNVNFKTNIYNVLLKRETWVYMPQYYSADTLYTLNKYSPEENKNIDGVVKTLI